MDRLSSTCETGRQMLPARQVELDRRDIRANQVHQKQQARRWNGWSEKNL